MKPAQLVAEIQRVLRGARDPERAEPMRRYMKSEMPFLGLPKPRRAELTRPILHALVYDRSQDFRAAVAALWAAAEYREERYVALDLLDTRPFRRLLDPDAVPLLEQLVTEGAWWDLVDACSGPIGQVLIAARPRMTGVLRGWAAGPDLWLRRSAMIAQLRHGVGTDFGLLTELIETALSAPGLAASALAPKDERFFLHKAAGWALRNYAWTDPEEVAAYVAQASLPALSRREATKNFDKLGVAIPSG